MRTIHVLRSGRNYFIDGIFWGDDEEGVMTYLREKGITPDEIAKALAGVAQAGDISSSTRERHGQPKAGVIKAEYPKRPSGEEASHVPTLP